MPGTIQARKTLPLTVAADKKPRLAIFILVAALILFAALLGSRMISKVELPRGTVLRFDDFDFTVLSAREFPAAKGESQYAVDIVVKNSAQRVDFDFQPDCVEVSANGEYLKPSRIGNPQTLAAGESLSRVAEFTGPPGLESLTIGFRFGGFVGQALDKILYGNRVIIVKTTKAGPTAQTLGAALQ